MKNALIIAGLLALPLYSWAQAEPCRVKMDDLAGSYVGDCLKDKAHGQGKAIGRDTYEGTFEKGYPQGTGTYTWMNGDYYEGNFQKGKRHGPGKMVFASVKADSVQVGVWKDDQWVGEEK